MFLHMMIELEEKIKRTTRKKGQIQSKRGDFNTHLSITNKYEEYQ